MRDPRTSKLLDGSYTPTRNSPSPSAPARTRALPSRRFQAVGRLEDALGADVVGRALAEAAAVRRRKRSGRVAEAARSVLVDPASCGGKRRRVRRSSAGERS